EVRQVTDRVTVLRDGTVAGTRVTREADVASLITLIVGSELAESQHGVQSGHLPQDLLRVSELRTRVLKGVSFHAREGEIVPLTATSRDCDFDSERCRSQRLSSPLSST